MGDLKRYTDARELAAVLRFEWHTRRSWYSKRAMIRGLWWSLVRRYPCEVCSRCGRPVNEAWHAEDDLWLRVVHPWHETESWFREGMMAPGILCARCFVELADERGVSVRGLYISPDRRDEILAAITPEGNR